MATAGQAGAGMSMCRCRLLTQQQRLVALVVGAAAACCEARDTEVEEKDFGRLQGVMCQLGAALSDCLHVKASTWLGRCWVVIRVHTLLKHLSGYTPFLCAVNTGYAMAGVWKLKLSASVSL
jgi:hypothetical protein